MGTERRRPRGRCEEQPHRWIYANEFAQALKLEWSVLDHRWKRSKDRDLDGVVREEDIDDFTQVSQMVNQAEETDEMMVDAMAQQEEEEIEAMLAMSQYKPPLEQEQNPHNSSLSDDEDYDSLFRDLLTGEEMCESEKILAGQMDMS